MVVAIDNSTVIVFLGRWAYQLSKRIFMRKCILSTISNIVNNVSSNFGG